MSENPLKGFERKRLGKTVHQFIELSRSLLGVQGRVIHGELARDFVRKGVLGKKNQYMCHRLGLALSGFLEHSMFTTPERMWKYGNTPWWMTLNISLKRLRLGGTPTDKHPTWKTVKVAHVKGLIWPGARPIEDRTELTKAEARSQRP
ncbi:hypothetical protein LIER_07832 [Lithospermum erythrorhizon]|uniref:Uncharacterized protein n=1 Tax=Lithospermum erythrorhizon TaxID=34254 RepID=A0AAV3PDY4_LITER